MLTYLIRIYEWLKLISLVFVATFIVLIIWDLPFEPQLTGADKVTYAFQSFHDVPEKYKHESVQINQGITNSKRKIEVKTIRGSAYMYTGQIMYYTISGGESIIKLSNGKEIQANTKISEMWDILNDSHAKVFFKMKSDIINCNHVIEFITDNNNYKHRGVNNYQYRAIMEDGKEISIPRGRKIEFYNRLDNLTID